MSRFPPADARHRLQGVTATMDAKARKADIRRRLILAKYPPRRAARFTDENDHDPLVLRACPRCRGSGKVGESWPERRADVDYVCEACGFVPPSGTRAD